MIFKAEIGAKMAKKYAKIKKEKNQIGTETIKININDKDKVFDLKNLIFKPKLGQKKAKTKNSKWKMDFLRQKRVKFQGNLVKKLIFQDKFGLN